MGYVDQYNMWWDTPDHHGQYMLIHRDHVDSMIWCDIRWSTLTMWIVCVDLPWLCDQYVPAQYVIIHVMMWTPRIDAIYGETCWPHGQYTRRHTGHVSGMNWYNIQRDTTYYDTRDNVDTMDWYLVWWDHIRAIYADHCTQHILRCGSRYNGTFCMICHTTSWGT